MSFLTFALLYIAYSMTDTLLKYNLGNNVTAFSTTRISPLPLSAEEVKAMGNYAAFNVTYYCGDNAERVAKNKAWLCNELGVNENGLWLPRQTHTANVLEIDAAFLDKDIEEQTQCLQEIDALITSLPHQCISVSTADCVPILLYDEKHHAIAAIHAGWRGTVQRISQVCLDKMAHTFGTVASDCKALIGPSISLDAFEVGEEVVAEFLKVNFPESVISHNYANKPHIDLWAANVFLLEEAGVELSNIQISGICTFQHHDTFFSARRLGIHSGRILTGICLNN